MHAEQPIRSVGTRCDFVLRPDDVPLDLGDELDDDRLDDLAVYLVSTRRVGEHDATLGGRSDENAAVGEGLGPGFDREQGPAAIGRVLDTYLSLRTGADERFPDTYARVGKAPFKEAVYVGA